ncbi:polysaccharide deacetylase family protein [Hymenobacter fodinae]|uniref:NodB homology domain-containing protein n=1 Tax=Hymenobacter fodinae TaxID=2510796 RepID=A0A4Z0P7R8_9BACT|nr:polysaccharide deacetylase family protein [Hymenobacter fodinae]TGE08040.1 hypothetical protein EU556_09885 [Hymenobacter fodinae]
MIPRLINKIKRIVTPRAAVLMYHRIGHTESDIWQLSVAPNFFKRQLQFLRSNYNVISLDTLLQQHKTNRIQRGSIAITFDDGYIDNYIIALPLLAKYNLPATFFVPTQTVDSPEEFWWDELEYILLHTPKLPQLFTALSTSHLLEFDLENEAILTMEVKQRHRAWVGTQSPTTRRAALYLAVWQEFKKMAAAERGEAMSSLRSWAGLVQPLARLEYTTGSYQQVIQADASGLVTIGGHTVTHPALSGLSMTEQYAEVGEGKSSLEQKLGKPIQHFAYPYGDQSAMTQAAVKNLGFQAAFTTHPATITAASETFALGRFQVNNWATDEFAARLATWLKYK